MGGFGEQALKEGEWEQVILDGIYSNLEGLRWQEKFLFNIDAEWHQNTFGSKSDILRLRDAHISDLFDELEWSIVAGFFPQLMDSL